VFENQVLRIFRPKRDKATGEWRKLHNDGFDDLYSAPNIVRVIKSRRMRWAGHVVSTRGGKGCVLGKLEGKRPLGRPSLDGRMILRWNSRKWDVGV